MSNIQLEQYFVTNGLLSDFEEDHTKMDNDSNPKEGTGTVFYAGKYNGFFMNANWVNDRKEGNVTVYTNWRLLLIEAVYVNNELNGHCIIRNSDSVAIFNGSVMNGLKDGICREYDNNGVIVFFGRYSMNQKVSTFVGVNDYYREKSIKGITMSLCRISSDFLYYDGFTAFYVNGKLNRYCKSDDGTITKKFSDGVMTEFVDDVTVYEGGFIDDFMKCYPRNGIGREYDITGQLINVSEWNDGSIVKTNKSFSGSIMTEYDENEVMIYEGCFYDYKALKRHGMGNVVKNGVVTEVNLYNFGSVVTKMKSFSGSVMIEYDEKKKIIYKGGFDAQLMRNGFGSEFIKGKLVCFVEYSKGIMIQQWKSFEKEIMTEYDNNGSMTYEGGFINDFFQTYPRDGKGRECDSTGSCIYNGEFSKGKREGHGMFYANGMLQYKGEWKNGLAEGRGALYDENGLTVEHKGQCTDGFMPIENGKLIDVVTKNMVNKYVVDKKRDFNLIPTEVDYLIVLNNRCNGRKINLCLKDYSHLERLIIGDNCFMNVKRFDVSELTWMITLRIGKNSFTKAEDGKREDKTRSFHITNCPNLIKVEIGRYSFSDYYGFEMKNVPKLKSLKIGDINSGSKNFYYCPEFHLISSNGSDFAELESIEIGRRSFQYVQSIRFENLPKLREIKLGDRTFNGDERNDRKGKNIEPYDYMNSLSMKNLPSLMSFTSQKDYNFGTIGSVFLENIPILTNILFSRQFSFDWVYSLNATSTLPYRVLLVDADSLELLIRGKSIYIRDYPLIEQGDHCCCII